MEQRDELWPDGPCFYYDTALFPPGTDSFALAYFARPARGDTVCDLGSGTGLLGTLLLAREDSLIIENVELSAPAAALARKSFLENGWEKRAGRHGRKYPARLRTCAPRQSAFCAMAGALPLFTAPNGSRTFSAPCVQAASSPSVFVFSPNPRTAPPRSCWSKESAVERAGLSLSRRLSPVLRSGIAFISANNEEWVVLSGDPTVLVY